MTRREISKVNLWSPHTHTKCTWAPAHAMANAHSYPYSYTYSCIHIYRRYARITWEIIPEGWWIQGQPGLYSKIKKETGREKTRREVREHAISELCPNPRHIHKKTFCEHQKQDVSAQAPLCPWKHIEKAVCFHSGMPSMPLVQRQRQDDHFEFEPSLVYI